MSEKEKLVRRLKKELDLDIDVNDIIDIYHGPIDRGSSGLSWCTLRRNPEVGSTISATKLNRAKQLFLHKNRFRINIDIIPQYDF